MKINLILTTILFFITGSLVSQQTIIFNYDDLNRLTRADYGNGTVINYTYDANGNRLTETVNSNSFMNVKLVLNGLYDEPANVLRMKDTVRAYLMNITSPFGVVDSAVSTIDSVNFLALFEFRNAQSGTYYLKIKHRNSIETWSKSGGFSFIRYTLMNYDFTSAQSQAYGNNMALINSLWCIHTGDVNQDGTIDISDASLIDNDASNFISGYVPTDINGDGIVDIGDGVYSDNNSLNFINKITP